MDTFETTKEIMRLIKIHFNYKDTKNQLGFSAMCSICGNGSITFCPCYEIQRLLDEKLNS